MSTINDNTILWSECYQRMSLLWYSKESLALTNYLHTACGIAIREHRQNKRLRRLFKLIIHRRCFKLKKKLCNEPRVLFHFDESFFFSTYSQPRTNHEYDSLEDVIFSFFSFLVPTADFELVWAHIFMAAAIGKQAARRHSRSNRKRALRKIVQSISYSRCQVTFRWKVNTPLQWRIFFEIIRHWFHNCFFLDFKLKLFSSWFQLRCNL